jgi:methylase of polypeptide subunit release factors
MNVVVSNLNSETVYQPAEDSFLLVDGKVTVIVVELVYLLLLLLAAIREDLSRRIVDTDSRNNFLYCLEIGCGSGFVSASIYRALTELGSLPYFLLTDINTDAAKTACDTMQLNKVRYVGRLFLSLKLNTYCFDCSRFFCRIRIAMWLFVIWLRICCLG